MAAINASVQSFGLVLVADKHVIPEWLHWFFSGFKVTGLPVSGEQSAVAPRLNLADES
jgi:hypothetical protein